MGEKRRSGLHDAAGMFHSSHRKKKKKKKKEIRYRGKKRKRRTKKHSLSLRLIDGIAVLEGNKKEKKNNKRERRPASGDVSR